MKRKKQIEELRSQTKKQLKELIKKTQEELIKLLVDKKAEKLKNVQSLREKRSNLARIKTILKEKERHA